MFRRKFLSAVSMIVSAVAFWPRRSRGSAASAVDPSSIEAAHARYVADRKAFDADVWLKRLQSMIQEVLPGVTFGEVTRIRDRETRVFSYMEPGHAWHQPWDMNGLMFAFLVDDIAEVQANPRLIDDHISRSVTSIVGWLKEMGVSYDDRLRCKINDFEMVGRIADRHIPAIRGIIHCEPAP